MIGGGDDHRKPRQRVDGGDFGEGGRSVEVFAVVGRTRLLRTQALEDVCCVGAAVIANKKFWDGLPADVRASLESAMKDATKFANDIAKKENDDSIEAVRKTGKTEIITLTPDQKAAMKKALIVVHKDNEGRVGKDTIAEVYKETGFKP